MRLPCSMWDGFWISSWEKKRLIISCSFDAILYRDFDLIFKQVTFFNLPQRWRDTNVRGNNLVRIASAAEFREQQPTFDISDRNIFAIDIVYGGEKHTFFILAKHVYLNKCNNEDNSPIFDYTAAFDTDKDYPSKRNLV